MPDLKKVIGELEYCRNNQKCNACEKCQRGGRGVMTCESLADDALALLKEQEDEKKRIMKVIWDTLHEGLSIDTVADQDWVYERIRHQIEGA